MDPLIYNMESHVRKLHVRKLKDLHRPYEQDEQWSATKVSPIQHLVIDANKYAPKYASSPPASFPNTFPHLRRLEGPDRPLRQLINSPQAPLIESLHVRQRSDPSPFKPLKLVNLRSFTASPDSLWVEERDRLVEGLKGKRLQTVELVLKHFASWPLIRALCQEGNDLEQVHLPLASAGQHVYLLRQCPKLQEMSCLIFNQDELNTIAKEATQRDRPLRRVTLYPAEDLDVSPLEEAMPQCTFTTIDEGGPFRHLFAEENT